MNSTAHSAVAGHNNKASIPTPTRTAKQRETIGSRILSAALLGDVVVIILGLLLGFWIRFRSGWVPWLQGDPHSAGQEVSNYLGLLVLGSGYFLLSLAYAQLYSIRYILRPSLFTAHMLRTACLWLAIYLGTSLFLKFDPPISRAYAIISFVTASMGLAAWRFILAGMVGASDAAHALRQRLTVVGGSREASQIIGAVQADEQQPYVLTQLAAAGEFNPYNPSTEELSRLISSGATDIILVADLGRGREDILEIASACERSNVEFKLVPDYFQVLISGLHLETISGVPILGVSHLPLDRFVINLAAIY